MILITWCVFCAWVIFSCASGYLSNDGSSTEIVGDVSPTGSELPTVIGLPAWVFWGIAVPWLFASGFTIWFAIGWLKDEPAAGEADE